MQRSNRPVVMLSEAATAFIRAYRSTSLRATTHWRDVQVLKELGVFPNVSLRYAEDSGGFITSAGGNYTGELVIDLIAKSLSHQEKAELGSRLVLQSIRDRKSSQPCGTSYLMNAFGPQILGAIRIMEDNVEFPISTRSISMTLGLSVRQLERLFTKYTGTSPGRYYKKIRVGRAHNLVTETNLSLVDVAFATGFGSVASLTSAYRSEYGKSPRETRVKDAHNIK